jgi:tRNA(fMet)-specific endonuclease VapC
VKHLLDSNACIHAMRKGAVSPVAHRIAAEPIGAVVLCSVVVGELRFGAVRSNNPTATMLKVEAFCAPHLSLPYDDVAAVEYALIRADLSARGLLIGPNDLLIAAIARANNLILVTNNTAEFSRVPGLKLEDWQIP